ncbi:MAG: cobalamin biosynthesis protein P47K [Oscillospiraceae bacterium]|jgi:G3E family GTPase|nr:cobalamin biosynthesis protein P47K [Oscillospiraceae bacterium]
MKILILGGFLGSGKTTALMQLARYMVDISDPGRENKVVILENEIGEVGIDDVYLRGGGFTVNNLFSGCACCTVSGELIAAVSRIRSELGPEWIIVETTGVAYPTNMRENLRAALGLESRICILVDASRWRRLLTPMRELLRGQLVGADTVLLNKIDKVDEDTLGSVERDILEFEPDSAIFRISALAPVPEDIWRAAAGISVVAGSP